MGRGAPCGRPDCALMRAEARGPSATLTALPPAVLKVMKLSSCMFCVLGTMLTGASFTGVRVMATV